MEGILECALCLPSIGWDQGRTIRRAAQDDRPQCGLLLPVCGRGIAVTVLTLPRLLGLHSPREYTGSGWLRACAGTLPLVLGIANNATGYRDP